MNSVTIGNDAAIRVRDDCQLTRSFHEFLGPSSQGDSICFPGGLIGHMPLEPAAAQLGASVTEMRLLSEEQRGFLAAGFRILVARTSLERVPVQGEVGY